MKDVPEYAEVVVSSYTSDADRDNIFDYAVPESLAGVTLNGMRVIVPFGSRRVEGYVVKIKGSTDVPQGRIRDILEAPDPLPLFAAAQIELARWMSGEYMCSLRESLKAMIPSEMALKEDREIALNDISGQDFASLGREQKRVVSQIRQRRGHIRYDELLDADKCSARMIADMIGSGILSVVSSMKSAVKDKTLKGVELAQERDAIGQALRRLESDRRAVNQVPLIKFMMDRDAPIAKKELAARFGFKSSTIDTLVKKGILSDVRISVTRDPYAGRNFDRCRRPVPTEDQRRVLSEMIDGFENGRRNYLLHGVTGSGKTEIYMRLIEYFIAKGKQAIMLVPEISLTPQTIERFKGRFDRVAVIHSRLSAGERYDEWKRIRNGEADIVVGARSAIFSPFKNIGIVILDEEQETSYKSDQNPKYLTRDVAYKLCGIEGAMLVLGSATPSVDTYYQALGGKYSLCTLRRRIDNRNMPEIIPADMRDEMEAGNRTVFSRKLYSEMKSALQARHQIILFLNRRGFSTFVSCRKCGLVMKCPKCDVSLTYHADLNILNCHLCGYSVRTPSICPSCGSRYIKYFGIGTQRLQSEVKKYFPEARVIRMDLDTTTKKGSHERIYDAFKNNEADILIGTQMIAKGLDFPNVVLVGIIAADQSLNMPDFRAAERTFQLITQVSGRAGRGRFDGKVVVQTYSPENYSIQSALHSDYRGFYDKEIMLRKAFNYPPFAGLISIIVSSRSNDEAAAAIRGVTETLKGGSRKNILILGPGPAPISKINNYYRWQTIIKGGIDSALKSEIKNATRSVYMKNKGIRMNIDINPVSMM